MRISCATALPNRQSLTSPPHHSPRTAALNVATFGLWTYAELSKLPSPRNNAAPPHASAQTGLTPHFPHHFSPARDAPLFNLMMRHFTSSMDNYKAGAAERRVAVAAHCPASHWALTLTHGRRLSQAGWTRLCCRAFLTWACCISALTCLCSSALGGRYVAQRGSCEHGRAVR